MFAVIKTGGKQYRIVANQVVKVEKVSGNAGDIVEFNDVLMIGQEGNAVIGTPVISDAVVTAEILEQARERKIIAFKKRRRQNSKRTRGHRQEFTTLRVLEILTGDSKPKKAAAKLIKEEATAVEETKGAAVEKKAEKKTASQKKAAVAKNKED
ncbi:large subunit ribosomal protein L21 [Bartonella fuyuanensis]|uniref:Large ribosomal subunit protein bL21 n=1 Tax=Bartonella fuyuanensis TaxID=1460968 RepID=A0A840E2N2_9HYPH|nr:50S ribosomal protein L21 [Bartonella fuyuanensis]MBB4076019.1 large subunit ribosomal protein L21 [Bartonella fuyuanensis]